MGLDGVVVDFVLEGAEERDVGEEDESCEEGDSVGLATEGVEVGWPEDVDVAEETGATGVLFLGGRTDCGFLSCAGAEG